MGIPHPNYFPTRAMAFFDALRDPSDRKLRLFMVECYRRLADLTGQPHLATAMDWYASYVDGRSTFGEFFAAFEAGEHAEHRETLRHVARPAARSAARKVLVRTAQLVADQITARNYPDLVYANGGAAGEAYWRAKCEPIPAEDAVRLAWLGDLFGGRASGATLADSWRSGAAVGLARAASDARDFSVLPVLADALEEAGCDDAGLLDHCRGGGPHIRGCWAVDLVLGRT